MVDRRRAGRRQWTASWALADAPRGRRGDPPAAAVRGAEAHLLYWHTSTCVPAASLTAAQVAGRYEKLKKGRPKGSKNKPKEASVLLSRATKAQMTLAEKRKLREE